MAARTGPLQGLAALGAALALEGLMARAAVIVAALTALGFAVVAVRLGQDGPRAPLELLPSMASGTVAWTAGFLLAVAGAAQGLRHDRERGVRQLAHLRVANPRAYLWGRIGGLAWVLLLVVGGAVVFPGRGALGEPRASQASSTRRSRPSRTRSLAVTLAPCPSRRWARALADGRLPPPLRALRAGSSPGGRRPSCPELGDVLSIRHALTSLRGALCRRVDLVTSDARPRHGDRGGAGARLPAPSERVSRAPEGRGDSGGRGS